ncbi:MAG: GNAT family N-acetyltransferase [Chlamydiota bacterium]
MKKYVFKPYSKIFPKLFDKEKARILSHISMPLAIEHIGSTAIPGLGGKGIIDIAVAVSKPHMDVTSKKLQDLGYAYRPIFSTPDRFYFIICLPDPEEENRRYHIHLTYPENHEWKEFTGFRDYLRQHPEECQEYAELKKQAALEANHEGDRYRKVKEPMFDKIRSLNKHFHSEQPPRKSMKIHLSVATKDDKNIIENLGRFYVYDMSRYCGFLPTWEVPSNGLFACTDLSSYLEKADRHAFLVKVDEELAGFVLINKLGSTPDVDWNVGEFFIVSKFQGKGVGRHVAEQVFDQFPGVWETSQILENTAAIEFWDRVVSQYTNGQFEKTRKIVPEPEPHPMVILKFTS